jgi:hypothetical protein
MFTIKSGDTGDNVYRWQLFLRGLNPYSEIVADGNFGKQTVVETKEFQEIWVLKPDGVVGPKTISVAEKLNFPVEELKGYINQGDLKPRYGKERSQLFGHIEYKPAPNNYNPEAIQIINDWSKNNLTKVEIPQLKGIYGAPQDCNIFFHKKCAHQLVNLFQDWEDNDLMHLVLSWAGTWVPRFVRGSRSILSNHAWATAFDINAAWNGLGRKPTPIGERGSVIELVPLANKHGFYWLGEGKRPDGMHFEISKIL